jgi:hypothetical protein
MSRKIGKAIVTTLSGCRAWSLCRPQTSRALDWSAQVVVPSVTGFLGRWLQNCGTNCPHENIRAALSSLTFITFDL